MHGQTRGDDSLADAGSRKLQTQLFLCMIHINITRLSVKAKYLQQGPFMTLIIQRKPL